MSGSLGCALPGGIQNLLQFLSTRLQLDERSDEGCTHIFPRALQTFPLRLKMGFQIPQLV